MKKPTDEECIERLQATADALAQAGASPYDIVTAFVDVALTLAERDAPYAQANAAIIADVFASGEALARRLSALLASKKPPKKK
jgi:formiminotetrahydrofolate cyclodeaminase